MDIIRECPCCGKKFAPSTGDIIEIQRMTGCTTIASQDITKGIIIHRKIGEIKTVVDNYESYETYACKDCAKKYWGIKRAAKIISIVIVTFVIVVFPIIGVLSDFALLCILPLFALIFIKELYRRLVEMSEKLLMQVCAKGKNFNPEIEYILKCQTHPSQIEQEVYSAPQVNNDDFEDLPY